MLSKGFSNLRRTNYDDCYDGTVPEGFETRGRRDVQLVKTSDGYQSSQVMVINELNKKKREKQDRLLEEKQRELERDGVGIGIGGSKV